MGWDKTLPVTGTNIVDIPDIHGSNWEAFQYTFEKEHEGFSETTSGCHKLGLTPVISGGPSAAVTAITGQASGGLGWDTDLGVAWFQDGSSVQQFNILPISRAFVYRNADYTIPASAGADNPDTVPFDTELKDTLAEYNNTTFTFTASATGYYYITARLSISTAVGGVELEGHIQVLDSNDVEQSIAGSNGKYSLSSDESPMIVSAVVPLTAGYKAKIRISHDYSSSIVLEGGAERTFMKIHRIA